MARFDACRVPAAAVLVLAGLLSGCSSHSSAFCQAVRHSSPGFDDGAPASAAVAALDHLIAGLPPADRGDLTLLRNYVAVVSFPAQHPNQAVAAIRGLAEAAPRLDRRLQRECGVSLGPLQTFFGHVKSATTTTGGTHP